MLHYVRDAQPFVRNGHGNYEFGYWEAFIAFFNFLRVMGWTVLYEGNGLGDSYGSVDSLSDGDMEASGTTSWTAIGTATLAKDKTTKHQAAQSLKITSAASGDGVQSSAWSAWGTTSNTFYVLLWASNDSGASWDVQVDNGGGSFASIGSIPDNGGVWTMYKFSYARSATANNYFKILDNNNTQGFIHIDDANAYRSYWEDSAYETGTDGDVVNGDEFESAAYDFDSGDLNKFLAIYDPDNLGNSGVYKIISLNGTNAVLDLRVGGSETLTNTTSQDLAWRLFIPPVSSAATMTEDTYAVEGSRVVMESPHASKWRCFFRLYCGSYTTAKIVYNMASPNDCPYNGGGALSGYGINQSASTYTSIPSYTGTYTHRLYAMVAGDGSFFAFAARIDELAGYLYPYAVMGYLSDDADYDEVERFAVLAPSISGSEQGVFVNTNAGFGYYGHCGNADGKRMSRCTVGVLNIDPVSIVDDVDSKANPFSTNEWIIPLLVCRDIDNEMYAYGEYEADRESALFYTRANMTEWATFDSNGYFHLCNGLVWKWMGVSV